MPKLYYTATSCGAANFIAAYIGGLKIDCEQVHFFQPVPSLSHSITTTSTTPTVVTSLDVFLVIGRI